MIKIKIYFSFPGELFQLQIAMSRFLKCIKLSVNQSQTYLFNILRNIHSLKSNSIFVCAKNQSKSIYFMRFTSFVRLENRNKVKIHLAENYRL